MYIEVKAAVKDTFKPLSTDDLRHLPTSVLFLSLVRSSDANQGAAIVWQLIKMFGLSGEFYTELYSAVHRALSAIRNNRVSAFEGELYTGSIEANRWDFRKCLHNRGVSFSGVSTRRGSTVFL